MRALRGRVSGLCQPTYVLDIPGGYGKVPVGPDLPGAGRRERLRWRLTAYPDLPTRQRPHENRIRRLSAADRPRLPAGATLDSEPAG